MARGRRAEYGRRGLRRDARVDYRISGKWIESGDDRRFFKPEYSGGKVARRTGRDAFASDLVRAVRDAGESGRGFDLWSGGL